MPDIGLREILMIAVAASAAYLLLSVLRLLWIARRKTRARAAAPVELRQPGGEASAAVTEVEPLAAPPTILEEAQPEPPPMQTKRPRRWLPQWIKADAAAEDAAAGAAAGPGKALETFGDQLFRSTLEAELQHLRSDVAGLREELRLLKAARRVTPQYNEAMMLAQRGIDAQGIAEQCGISVGEAELVLALSRNKQEYEDYGEDDPRRSAG